MHEANPGGPALQPSQRIVSGRRLRIAAVVALSLLLSACGSSPTTSSGSSHLRGALAFARCMRAHGVASFPDPDPQGEFPSFRAGVSKSASEAATGECKHLLSSGGGTASPQQRRQKFAFALKVAECLRTHGFPDFPDPTASGQSVPPDVDTSSPQFQAPETACEKQARKALGLP